MGGAALGALAVGTGPSGGGAAEAWGSWGRLGHLREVSVASSSSRDPSPGLGALQLTVRKFLLPSVLAHTGKVLEVKS